MATKVCLATRRLRLQRKLVGLCRQCGLVPPWREGASYCVSCNLRGRAWTAARRKRLHQKRACLGCGGKRSKGYVRCGKCLRKAKAAQLARRRRPDVIAKGREQ